ncbi:hypothetical protein [Oceanicella sp. SM1341]|uniref:DUF6950 family protein n=1 Tax=Oceanicella sp. SM1341 TaxID=1548889 RepID=UPI000E4845F9|nr:hypothetical protein [Oceanicella sp. SM1341]
MARELSAARESGRDIALTPPGEDVLAHALRVMDRPFAWGHADCCTAACDVFEALFGIDPMAELRGRYATAAGAMRIIAGEGGFAALAERLASTAGLAPGQGGGTAGALGLSAPGTATGPQGRALLVCIAPGAWAAKSEGGMSVLPGVERHWHA